MFDKKVEGSVRHIFCKSPNKLIYAYMIMIPNKIFKIIESIFWVPDE